jgi:hypothetical protein
MKMPTGADYEDSDLGKLGLYYQFSSTKPQLTHADELHGLGPPTPGPRDTLATAMQVVH